ncbi:mitochondrial fission ELM1 family protein [Marinobacter sp. SS21]|uniref:mitochondrial fission ELM1 family protein n=1 Tax=Marinobacter sp. SS21 TaxID=2979460 RepID=UPI00232F05C6|nr:ELM1/GtrOC1 family putative glycosyltransferase [Marinobacter sp. SS21]MDC0663095.1 ELM1/GtrOC1 family putative glycosyltransferase [Marinobacter sp. SS21]
MATARPLQGPAPVVWLLTDNKPGHRNQLQGLANRLRVLAGASIHWLEAKRHPVSLLRALMGLPPKLDGTLPAPNLILAAGTGTHRLLLSLRRLRRCRTTVLMRPSFPLAWVDAAIIPRHDNPRPSHHVLPTDGVLNAITPLSRLTDKPEALILIGGPSRHFDWTNNVVVDQILHLMQQHPDWRWTLSGSRRTPAELMERLQSLESPKVTVIDHRRCGKDWLASQLAQSRAVWVTPDSGSMVFEAVTSGVPTGLFELVPSPHSRIAAGIATLLEDGRVALWSDQAGVMDQGSLLTPRLWEADRAANWLIDTLLTDARP